MMCKLVETHLTLHDTVKILAWVFVSADFLMQPSSFLVFGPWQVLHDLHVVKNCHALLDVSLQGRLGILAVRQQPLIAVGLSR